MERLLVDVMIVEGGLMCGLFFSGTGPGSGTLDRGRRLYPDWYVLRSQWALLTVGPKSGPQLVLATLSFCVITMLEISKDLNI